MAEEGRIMWPIVADPVSKRLGLWRSGSPIAFRFAVCLRVLARRLTRAGDVPGHPPRHLHRPVSACCIALVLIQIVACAARLYQVSLRPSQFDPPAQRFEDPIATVRVATDSRPDTSRIGEVRSTIFGISAVEVITETIRRGSA